MSARPQISGQSASTRGASPPSAFLRRAAIVLLLLMVPLLVGAALPAVSAAFRPVSFEDVDFVSTSTGFAVGTPGSLYVTANGGASWSLRPMGNNDWLTAVDFVSAKVGWVLGVYNEGEPARIWHTRDGGRHWVLQTNPTDGDVLTDVAFTDKQKGVIVGRCGTILRTANGGDTWSAVASGTGDGLRAVDFPTASVGYVTAAGGGMLKTTSGGTSWTPLSTGATQVLRGVHFVSAQRGWAVGGGGAILATTNGGADWDAQTSGTTKALADVDFASATRGWAVGANGTILRTTNGGDTWTAQASGTVAFLFAVDFTSAAHGCVVGELQRPPGSDPWAFGIIRRTTTSGRAWKKAF